MSDLLKRELDRLLCGRLGRPVRHLDSVGSTNAEALAWAAGDAAEGALVIADEQTAGRGRWGRTWLSGPGASLTFSFVLRPPTGFSELGLLPITLGVAVAEAVEELTALRVSIKWPNDITHEGRKLAGILVESRLGTNGATSVVAGVGINLGWGSDEIPEEIAGRASSLAIELGSEPPTRAALLAAILSWFEPLYDSLLAGHPSEILARATARSELLGKHVTVRHADGNSLSGRAIRLLPSGALELEIDGVLRGIDAGEIERIRPS